MRQYTAKRKKVIITKKDKVKQMKKNKTKGPVDITD